MPVQLNEAAVFVPEQALLAVHTSLMVLVVKGPTVFIIQLAVVAHEGSHCELILAMSVATVAFPSAFGRLEPILAELDLVVALGVTGSSVRALWKRLVRCEGLLDRLGRLGIVHIGVICLCRHVGGHARQGLHLARHKVALGTPVEARRASIYKGPRLRCGDATLHERVTTSGLWVDCLISHWRHLLDIIGKLRNRSVSLCQMQVRKLWEILSQIAVHILDTIAFHTCLKASLGVVQICLLTLNAVCAVDGPGDALVLLASPYASAALLPCHLSGDGCRILSL